MDAQWVAPLPNLHLRGKKCGMVCGYSDEHSHLSLLRRRPQSQEKRHWERSEKLQVGLGPSPHQSPPPHQVAAILARCSLGAVDQTWHNDGKRPPQKISLLHPLRQKSPSSHTPLLHASCIMHHVHCDCLAPQYWEYYPNIMLCYIGHPCHSSDFWRTLKLKLSS